MPKLFISYATQDVERVRPLADAFTRHGWTVWWNHDQELTVIEQQVTDADCVLGVLTKNSVESPWVQR